MRLSAVHRPEFGSSWSSCSIVSPCVRKNNRSCGKCRRIALKPRPQRHPSAVREPQVQVCARPGCAESPHSVRQGLLRRLRREPASGPLQLFESIANRPHVLSSRLLFSVIARRAGRAPARHRNRPELGFRFRQEVSTDQELLGERQSAKRARRCPWWSPASRS